MHLVCVSISSFSGIWSWTKVLDKNVTKCQRNIISISWVISHQKPKSDRFIVGTASVMELLVCFLVLFWKIFIWFVFSWKQKFNKKQSVYLCSSGAFLASVFPSGIMRLKSSKLILTSWLPLSLSAPNWLSSSVFCTRSCVFSHGIHGSACFYANNYV